VNPEAIPLSEEVRFTATSRSGEVSGLLLRPRDAVALLVLAHGAGAGMRHAFLEDLARSLAGAGFATLRYQFPYTEKKLKRPDPPAILTATVRAAVRLAAEKAGGLPLFAGGKSMGGRMTSTAQASEPLPGVRGLAFFGFPLHAAGKPELARAAHLADVQIPTLFLQGTRDALADLDLIRTVTAELGDSATLHITEGADHSFHVLKRSGRTDQDVMQELVATFRDWSRGLIASPGK
jgi:predicted alpha/beta-hydrolase family hydrolase